MMNEYEKRSLIILIIILVTFSVGYIFADVYITTLPSEVKYTKVVSSMAEKEEEIKKAKELEKAKQQEVDGSSVEEGKNNTKKEVNIRKYRTSSGYEYFHYKGYLFLNGAKMKIPSGFKFVQEENNALAYSDYKDNTMAVISQEYVGNMDYNINAFFTALGTMGTTGDEKQVVFGKNKYRYRKYVIASGQGIMTTHIFVTGNSKKIVAILLYSYGNTIGWEKEMLTSVAYY